MSVLTNRLIKPKATRLMTTTPVAAPNKSPLAELNFKEMFGVRKWAEAAQADLCDQVQRFSRDKTMSATNFKATKQAAEFVVAYLASAVAECDRLLDAEIANDSGPSIHPTDGADPGQDGQGDGEQHPNIGTG